MGGGELAVEVPGNSPFERANVALEGAGDAHVTLARVSRASVAAEGSAAPNVTLARRKVDRAPSVEAATRGAAAVS